MEITYKKNRPRTALNKRHEYDLRSILESIEELKNLIRTNNECSNEKLLERIELLNKKIKELKEIIALKDKYINDLIKNSISLQHNVKNENIEDEDIKIDMSVIDPTEKTDMKSNINMNKNKVKDDVSSKLDKLKKIMR